MKRPLRARANQYWIRFFTSLYLYDSRLLTTSLNTWSKLGRQTSVNFSGWSELLNSSTRHPRCGCARHISYVSYFAIFPFSSRKLAMNLLIRSLNLLVYDESPENGIKNDGYYWFFLDDHPRGARHYWSQGWSETHNKIKEICSNVPMTVVKELITQCSATDLQKNQEEKARETRGFATFLSKLQFKLAFLRGRGTLGC